MREVSKEVVVELGERLLDTEQPFAKRYRCLFSLMNVKASEETRQPLTQVLREHKYGALMRHEVAYVLGQMQDSNKVSTGLGLFHLLRFALDLLFASFSASLRLHQLTPYLSLCLCLCLCLSSMGLDCVGVGGCLSFEECSAG